MADKEIKLSVAADISQVVTGFNQANELISKMKDNADKYNDSMKDGSKSIGGLEKALGSMANVGVKAFNALKVAIGGTGIGLIIVAFGLLYTWMSKNKDIMDKVSQVTAGMSAGFNKFASLIPEIGKLVLNVLILPFKNLLAIGQSIVKLFSGDFQGALDKLKEIPGNYKAIAKEASGITNEIIKSTKAGYDWEKQQQQLDSQARKNKETIANLTSEMEKQERIANDSTLSAEQRNAAAKKSSSLKIQIANLEMSTSRAQMNLDKQRLDEAIKNNSTEQSELRDKYNESLSLFKQHQGNLDAARREGAQRLKDVTQANFDIQTQNLFMTLDANKEVLDAQLDLQTKSVADRKKLNEEYTKDSIASIDKQMDVLSKLTNKRIDWDDLVKTTNATELNGKLKLLGLNDTELAAAQDLIEKKKLVNNQYNESLKTLNQERIDDLKATDAAELAMNQEKLNNAFNARQEAQMSDLEIYYANEELKAQTTITNSEQLSIRLQEIELEKQQKLTEIQLQQEQEKETLLEEQRNAAKLREIELMTIDEEEKNRLKEDNKLLNEENLTNIQSKFDKKRTKLTIDNEKAAAKASKEIAKAKRDAAIGLANDALENAMTIVGKESKVGKALAVAQTTITTFQSATNAFNSLSGIHIVGPALGAIAAAAAVASGMANVKKILAVPMPETKGEGAGGGSNMSKFETGGWIGGNPHSQGGTILEAEKGEFIVNKKTMSNPLMANAIMNMNDSGNNNTSASLLSKDDVAQIVAKYLNDVKIYVVESEITEIQKKVSIREQRATY